MRLILELCLYLAESVIQCEPNSETFVSRSIHAPSPSTAHRVPEHCRAISACTYRRRAAKRRIAPSENAARAAKGDEGRCRQSSLAGSRRGARLERRTALVRRIRQGGRYVRARHHLRYGISRRLHQQIFCRACTFETSRRRKN